MLGEAGWRVGCGAPGGVRGAGARGEGYQRQQCREYPACAPRSLLGRTARRPGGSSAPRGSLRQAQRELRVLAILALAREAHLAPLISRCARSCVTRSYLVRCLSARMARSARVDLIAELQCCFARSRHKIFTR